MGLTIYFFTGTGNSLKIAKDLAEKLGDCELIPIAKIWQEENLKSESEKIGFIFPLYYSGLPKIVYDFVEKIDLSKSSYFFSVVASAGGIIKLPFQQLEIILNTKGKKLQLGYIIVMPTNYIIAYKAFSEDHQNLLFQKANEQVEVISEMIKNERTNVEQDIRNKEFFIYDGKYRADKFNSKFRENVNERDNDFYTDDNCNSCGVCESVCPVNNILMINGAPEWQHKCQLCLACINYCPEMAIQFGTQTLKKQRYHNPEITIEEISNQKK